MIKNNNSITFDIWHVVNGVWYHICQTEDGVSRRYYTDGQLVAEWKIGSTEMPKMVKIDI